MSFIPPQEVAKEAKLGLELRKLYKRGMTSVGIKRAVQLSRRDPVSLNTIKRMVRFFQRHQKNRSGFFPNGDPKNGVIAWLGWGGDSGYEWALKMLRKYGQ